MIRTLLLIFDPIPTWERIVRAQRSLLFILVVYLLPLLVLTSAWEAYGLVHWGKIQGTVPRLKRFSVGEAAGFEAAQFGLSLAVVFICAKLVKSLGQTFHGRHTYTQAFTAVAYGLGPVFLLRLLDAFSGVSPWVSWSIGIILSIAVLYHGLPQVMQPDPPHAFGLYLMSSLLLVLISGLVRFLTAWYLQGRFARLEALISG
jgi:hypothetical protein